MDFVPQMSEIPLDKIYQIENSRSEYREAELSELMTSMKQIGLLQAIGVKAIDKNRFEVVFGNRRFVAAKKLGWKTIAAVMTEAETEEDFLLKNTTENIVRAGVPLSEQGRIFYKLTKLGLTPSEIAARTGISVRIVRNCLDLFRQIPIKYQSKIITGERVGERNKPKNGFIPMGSAKAIRASMKDFNIKKEDAEPLFRLAAEDNVSIATIREVSKLVGQGFPISDAIKKASNVRTVRITLVLANEEIERIESKYKTSIGMFLHSILEADGRIKNIVRDKH